MSRFIVKIRDCYLEWSTVVDAPVTTGMPLDDFRRYYLAEYGAESGAIFEEFIDLADESGASDDYDWQHCNRAGPEETSLTEDELYHVYCLGNELDPEVVSKKLLARKHVENHSTIDGPLCDNPTLEQLQTAYGAIAIGMALLEVEALLGKRETVNRKRRGIVVRWVFPSNVITCHFDKTNERLQSKTLNPNYRTKDE